MRNAAIVVFTAPWQELKGYFTGVRLVCYCPAVMQSKRTEVGSLAPTVFSKLAPFGLIQPPENALLNCQKGRSFPTKKTASQTALLSSNIRTASRLVSRFDNVLCDLLKPCLTTSNTLTRPRTITPNPLLLPRILQSIPITECLPVKAKTTLTTLASPCSEASLPDLYSISTRMETTATLN